MSSSTQLLSRTLGKMSSRLFPIRGLAVASILLFTIGTAGFLSIHYLKISTRMVVDDTLAGLSDSSLANANLVEGFNRMVLVVMLEPSGERNRYRREGEQYNQQVNSSIAAYSRSVFTPEDTANYNNLLQSRREYLDIRQQILGLIDKHDEVAARRLFKESLVPAYRIYKSTAERVMKYNADEGVTRGEIILQICAITQFVIAGAGIGLFLLGFLIGLFK